MEGPRRAFALAGHARPFTDIQAHIDANRGPGQLDATRAALGDEPKSAYEVARVVYAETYSTDLASWLITMTRAWLVHLQRLGEVRNDGGDPWSAGSSPRGTRRDAHRRTDRERDRAGLRSSSSRPRPTTARANLEIALGEPRATRSDVRLRDLRRGGTPAERGKTIDIVSSIKANHGLEAMAHFTCVGASVDELRAVLDRMRDAGIENVLALRGDPPAGVDAKNWVAARRRPELLPRADRADPRGLRLRDRRGLLPGGPPRPTRPSPTLQYTREKVDAGARFLVTQLFFDNDLYYDFVARAREAGIDVPIIPGIMPITNVNQVKRFTEMCGASIPPGLLRELELRADQPHAVADFGVAYATMQCADLLANGAPGIHFYTLNRSPSTRAILSALRCLAPWRKAVSA